MISGDASSPKFHLDWQLRQRIFPALVTLDGLHDAWPQVQQVYDLLVGRDLDFDLRQGPNYPSNLCEDNAAIELAYTFGGPEQCGLRYSFEPTSKPGVLSNRYTLFRDRLRALQNMLGDDYDLSPLLHAAQLAVPRHLMRQAHTTVTIAAVHHYRDRPPRIKGYFSCDHDDSRLARQVALNLVEIAGVKDLQTQTQGFFRHFRPQGGVRMVGLDVEPKKPLGLKVYKNGAGLSAPALRRLVEELGGGADALAGLRAFQDIFLGGKRSPALLDLVCLALKPKKPAGLKIYIRPVDYYGDEEALQRLQRWYQWLGREHDFAVVMQGLEAVAPLTALANTRGFFNYFSVDLGPAGVSKTSVYFAPQILLASLAQQAPEDFLGL